MKKLLTYIIVFLSVFLIYKLTFRYSINYVALGDSITASRYPYGSHDYGYTNYIKDYLDEKDILNSYNFDFASDGYTIKDVSEDLYNNKTIGKNNIRKLLRESDLVTITIGANDLIKDININNLEDSLKDLDKLKNKIDIIIGDLDSLIKEIKKYAKKDIILIGYYNPFPYLETYKSQIDDLVEYANIKYKEVTLKNDIYYIDIFKLFDGKTEFLPNPFDIHPNNYGYKAIFSKIKTLLDKKIIKKD